MKVADYAEHIRVIKGLLAGETVDYRANGITHPIHFQSLELGHINIETTSRSMSEALGPGPRRWPANWATG